MEQEKIQPQFIFWVKDAEVFRPAKPKMPENYLGYDLEKNIELGKRDIFPESLNLVSSVYLGPVNIFEEYVDYSMSEKAFERLKQHRHGIADGIVGLAEDQAKEKGVPYFAVDVIRTHKDRTWKFEQGDDWLYQEIILEEEKNYLYSTKNKAKNPTEFVLHPTAQLYMLRV